MDKKDLIGNLIGIGMIVVVALLIYGLMGHAWAFGVATIAGIAVAIVMTIEDSKKAKKWLDSRAEKRSEDR